MSPGTTSYRPASSRGKRNPRGGGGVCGAVMVALEEPHGGGRVAAYIAGSRLPCVEQFVGRVSAISLLCCVRPGHLLLPCVELGLFRLPDFGLALPLRLLFRRELGPWSRRLMLGMETGFDPVQPVQHQPSQNPIEHCSGSSKSGMCRRASAGDTMRRSVRGIVVVLVPISGHAIDHLEPVLNVLGPVGMLLDVVKPSLDRRGIDFRTT